MIRCGERSKFRSGDAWNDDGEFIPTETGHRILGPYHRLKALRTREQDLVPRIVTVEVIDALEAIQVDVQKSDVAAHGTPGPGFQCAGELGHEEGAVCQSGERIVCRLVDEDFFRHFSSGDVDVRRNCTTSVP